MDVAILTETQKNSLMGELIQPDWYFNPVQDCNGDWVIFEQEINASIYPQNDWIKSLPISVFCKPVPVQP